MLAAFVLLVAAAAYASTIRATITWTDVAGETGYRIERAINNGGPGNVYAAIGTVAADVTTFADNAVVAGTSYCWRVVAFSALGDGLPSTPACASTPSVPPQVGGIQVIITVVP